MWKLNPGPGFRVKNNAVKCSICNKAVGAIRKRAPCVFDFQRFNVLRNHRFSCHVLYVCQHLTHLSCLNISKIQQKKKYTLKTIPLHTCTACTLTELPFRFSTFTF